jgi:hypothetical protein
VWSQKGILRIKKGAPHGAIETTLPIEIGLTSEHLAQTAKARTKTPTNPTCFGSSNFG